MLALIITTAGVSLSVSADEGEGVFRNKKFNCERQDFLNKAEIDQALENSDYNAWKSLVGENKMSETITEENFSKLVESYNLMKQGDFEGAKALRQELGLKARMNKGFEKGPNYEQMVQALENNDYEAWKSIAGDKKITETITAENFSKLVEAHNLMKQGDLEGAKAIKDELGLKELKPRHKMMKKGFGEHRQDRVEDND